MSALRFICLGLVLALAAAAWGQDSGSGDGSPASPKRHFRIERPADLSDADALSIYAQILDDLVAGYRLSGDPTAIAYRKWRRHSRFPYRSATHGERFVNNYANPKATGYGRGGPAMPVGAILAKDSFAVTSRGDVFSGPLFVMEKMAPGFNPTGRDWRYTMIMPDGSLFGRTGGQGSDRVGFCVTCHTRAGDENDHLFFVPPDYQERVMSVPTPSG